MFQKDLNEIFPEPPEGLDPTQLDEERVPKHVAVIMDGNGRWAKQRALNRLRGHKAGIEAVRETIRCASDVGVRFLTIYSFSTENWKRPAEEVNGLMDMFARTMLAELDGLHEEHVRVRTVGDISALPEKTQKAFAEAEELTRENDGLTLLIAVNYGGRQELVDAAQRLVDQAIRAYAETGEVPSVTSDMLAAQLYAPDVPDPELLIRTSGERRVSNFLLWQIAYTEFAISSVLWPDFDRYELLRMLLEYQGRSRRFGAV